MTENIHFNSKKNSGFTLAEILITVGIIGIVAQMTIPVLMQNAGDRANIVALKKEVSVINQVIMSATEDEGSMDYWYTPPSGNDFSQASTAINKIFTKHLKISKNCDVNPGCLPNSYSWLSRTESENFDSSAGYSKLKLADGSIFFFTVSSGGSLNIQVIIFYLDVNGLKGPNRVGDDLFVFYAYGDLYATPRGLKPNILYAAGQTTGALKDAGCSINDSENSGINCTSWAYNQNNLDYKYVDDLNWETKTHR